MTLINFGHPLTKSHLNRIAELAGRSIEQSINVTTHFNQALPFYKQVCELIDSVPLTAEQWQTTSLIFNMPSLAPIGAVLLAELHGRTGYFPTIIRLCPKESSIPPEYEVSEILNLQAIRDNARAKR